MVCYGTGKYAQVAGISVAGKTGTTLLKAKNRTASKGQQNTVDPTASDYVGADGKKEYYSTFVGYFPADNPQVTILVSIDSPNPESQDRFGGKAAGPLFATLATIAMHELRVSPSPATPAAWTAEDELHRSHRSARWSSRPGSTSSNSMGTTTCRSTRSSTTRVGSLPDRCSAACAARTPTGTTSPQQRVTPERPALLVDHQLEHRRAAAGRAGHPSGHGLVGGGVPWPSVASLTLVGVTGTNGKTTTTSFVAAILEAAGRRTGTIGTLTGTHTTPESPDLQSRLAGFVEAGMSAVVMEVSSHALALHRVVGCHFDVAVFTNLGRDHLDLHGTAERYFAAKASLFRPELADVAVVNATTSTAGC